MTLDLSQIHGENCPDLMAVMNQLMTVLGTATNQKICSEAQAVLDLAMEGDQALRADIDSVTTAVESLTNIPDFTSQLTNLTNLLSSLDMNENGAVLDDLLNIQNVAEQALTQVGDLATTVEGVQNTVTQNGNLLTQLSQTFSNFQLSIAQTIENLTQRITNCENRLDSVEGDIEGIQTQIQNLEVSSSGADYCAITNALSSGLDAFGTAFAAALNASCELVTGNEPPAPPAPAA